MKIVLAGGHGFIGSHLAQFFYTHQCVILSRDEGAHYWNPATKQIDPAILEGADVVINLTGESILGKWTQEKIEQIRQSRLEATEFLVDEISKLKVPPKLYVGASAIGYYGDRGDEVLTEASASGHGYLAETCRLWEQIPEKLTQTRVALARFGLVLGKGGALEKMVPPFRLGLGGVLGDGKQMMSWISIDDVCGAMQHLIDHEVSGPVNFTAPGTLSNREFTQILGKVLKRPTPLPIPKWALRFLFGSGADVFLSSLNVQPEKLLKSGYQFKHSDLESALPSLVLS